VAHIIAFYLVALLSGQLARLLESARAQVTTVQTDLRRVEAFQAAVLESLPVAVVTLGEDGTVQTANAAAARILGQPLDRLIGDQVPQVVASLARAEDGLHEITAEIDGRRAHLSVNRAQVSLPVDNTASTRLAVLAIEDRTELQLLHDDLRAKERLASVGQMAAAIAHELRNPLAAISGSVELLRAGAGTNDSRQRLEAIVLREIDRLNNLVNDFLLYARPSPIQSAPADLAALVRDLCLFLERDPAWKDHRLLVTAPMGCASRSMPARSGSWCTTSCAMPSRPRHRARPWRSSSRPSNVAARLGRACVCVIAARGSTRKFAIICSSHFIRPRVAAPGSDWPSFIASRSAIAVRSRSLAATAAVLRRGCSCQ